MATNPYVNKVQFGNQTVMDITDTTAEEADVVSGKTFYKANGARSTGSAVIPDISNCYQTTDTAGTDIQDADYFPFYDSSATAKKKSLWSNIKAKLKTYFDRLYANWYAHDYMGAKNFIERVTHNQTISYASSGTTLSVVVNSDKTIKLNGTLPSAGDDITDYNSFVLPKEKLEFSGCPVGGGSGTYSLVLMCRETSNPSSYIAHYDTGYGNSVDNSAGTYTSAYVVIRFSSNVTCSNLTFSPMLRLYDDPDTTYMPYAKTNKELTDIAPTYIERSYVTVSAGQVVRIPSGDEDYRIQSTSAIFPVCSSDASYTSIAQENGHVNITMATALTNATVGIFVYNS